MATPPASQHSQARLWCRFGTLVHPPTCQVLPQASPLVPVSSADHGSEESAELPVRGASALGVSSGRGNPVIDLTLRLVPVLDRLLARPPLPSSPGDTTSDATIKSSSADQVTSDPVSTLVVEQGNRHHEEHIQLARLIAFAVTQPPEPSDSAQRHAILHAESASALVDILRGVQRISSEATGCSSLDQVAQLKLQLETSERECHLWKREVDKSVGLVTYLRKALTASGAELKQARAAQTAEVTATQSALRAAELMSKSRDEDITALSK
ncbi:LOW QUALITY PROTEIN: Hypothetical protein PHPALM_4096 [Phytophthora palmivora]|uniref:Uncharacterized protein n=1 Tax=Phytophthora palmivora TaxID=4796 RepID=A0A2P4YKV7_9STRA|nr:LOW QUALITY PROTEIN: Hypothetical protein PHPALM_4096 [Phytophthora palmivora]